ncbi:C2 domain [Sesbania bispinosa]|nr:C2 domain [Sesbania bispinosa]
MHFNRKKKCAHLKVKNKHNPLPFNIFMGKIWIEVCLISARGVRGSLSLWKRHWYAVGWVDPKTKYCTKIDASGNANPVWRTKFAIQVDNSEPNFQDLALNLEVYSRDPVFLTEKLHGSATVFLKEFLAKQLQNPEISRPGHEEEVGSYQLRKKKSNKPKGFIDVSIRISEDKEEPNSLPGNGEGIVLLDHGNNGGFGKPYPNPQQMAPGSFNWPEKQAQTNVPYSHPVPFPTNYSNPYVGGPSYPAAAGPSYQPHRAPPPPPPPPSNVGYIPTFHPSNDGLGPSYFNMPSSSGAAPRQRGPPGFAMGAGAGALAAGAVMFGDNFMSGFHVPSGLGDPTLTIATDPLF